MNFPQFWAQGSSRKFSCWRWSSQSITEAQSLADAAARQLAECFRAGQRPPSHGGYYPDVDPVVKIHDEATRAESKLDLA